MAGDGEEARRSYALQQRILSRTPQVPISEAEFNAMLAARKVLAEALSLEEIYGILVANYGDFERSLVLTSVDEMVGSHHGYDYFFSVRQELSRRLVNLLTATRLYLDQIERHVRRAVPESEGDDAWATIKGALTAAYDQHFEYRFMEALRNRTQHRGVPADSLSLGGDRDASGYLAFRADVYSTREQVSRDRKFKPSVLAEMPEKVDLKSAVRVYVSALSEVHGHARTRIEASVNACRALLASAITSYPSVEGPKPFGLHALCFLDGKVVDKFPVMLDWDDTRQKLIKRNRVLRGLSKHFVTSRVAEKKDA